ncbi:hypothetical protein EGJ23_04365 [Pseudomonas sp. o96-267]|uniref:hypothetical protein n=1 Tax=Pseudomonas sp. o96-267 TaxID=2479853 RepID=UPI000F79E047|nr:hypothetical protein [Pseudomonas sp. o96-267]RRV28620.1 hypothetical protein EGJ23_04365 [Pseudomonas sp. o96-267]
MTVKKGKSWGEMSGGQKKALMVGWVVIAAMLAFIVLPDSDEPAKTPEQASALAAASPAVTYQTASTEALTAAKQLMSDLDQALQDGLPLLKAGDPRALGAHSQHFDSLVESAYARFGSTIFEPLGSCGVASNFARSSWKTQASAAVNGADPVAGAAQDALEQFQGKRVECLEAANPSGGTETHG